jgi:hypothetical protein
MCVGRGRGRSIGRSCSLANIGQHPDPDQAPNCNEPYVLFHFHMSTMVVVFPALIILLAFPLSEFFLKTR